MESFIEQAVYTSYRQLVEAQEKYIIAFFGTEERARELAHLYVLEDHGSQMELAQEYKMQLTTTWRLRLKTPEELAQE